MKNIILKQVRKKYGDYVIQLPFQNNQLLSPLTVYEFNYKNKIVSQDIKPSKHFLIYEYNLLWFHELSDDKTLHLLQPFQYDILEISVSFRSQPIVLQSVAPLFESDISLYISGGYWYDKKRALTFEECIEVEKEVDIYQFEGKIRAFIDMLEFSFVYKPSK